MKAVIEIFWRFLALGCVCFGGPAAHLGYFQTAFVQKLKWIDQEAYGRLVSLSQFLPGPGSSQVGFAIGLRHAGIAGGVAAFLGFTLPSFLLMYFLASATYMSGDSEWLNGAIHGLKLLAVVVVADAVLTMSRAFCKERLSCAIAVLTAVMLLGLPGLWAQMVMLCLAALTGSASGRPVLDSSEPPEMKRLRVIPFALFILLFFALPFLSWQGMALFADFYHAGSLVFGGGHVVLPLLQQVLGESVSTDRFLLGYAAAQAVPGPMFSFATFLGAELSPANPFTGSLIATLGIFLPGFLLVLSFQHAWESFATRPRIAGAVWGINASVVGLLIAALYQPIFVSAVSSALDMALVIVGFFLVRQVKVPILLLVLGFIFAGIWLV